jgi:hypothetical protein
MKPQEQETKVINQVGQLELPNFCTAKGTITKQKGINHKMQKSMHKDHI